MGEVQYRCPERIVARNGKMPLTLAALAFIIKKGKWLTHKETKPNKCMSHQEGGKKNGDN